MLLSDVKLYYLKQAITPNYVIRSETQEFLPENAKRVGSRFTVVTDDPDSIRRICVGLGVGCEVISIESSLRYNVDDFEDRFADIQSSTVKQALDNVLVIDEAVLPQYRSLVHLMLLNQSVVYCREQYDYETLENKINSDIEFGFDNI